MGAKAGGFNAGALHQFESASIIESHKICTQAGSLVVIHIIWCAIEKLHKECLGSLQVRYVDCNMVNPH